MGAPAELSQPRQPVHLSIVTPPVWHVLGSAARDSLQQVTQNYGKAFSVLPVAGLAVAYGLRLYLNQSVGQPLDTAHFDQTDALRAIIISWNVAGLIGQPIAIATAIRTHQPAFKMTASLFVLGLLVALLVSIVTYVGLCLLIIPGIYLGARLYLAYTAFLIGERNPFATSWNLSGYAIWPTMGLAISALLIQLCATAAAVSLAIALSSVLVRTVLLAAPFVFYVYVWAFEFGQLCALRWLLLLKSADSSVATSAQDSALASAPF
jgi:hypothetical protein